MKRGYWYLILFAVWPVIALYGANLVEVKPWMAVRPILLSLAGTWIIFLLISLVTKNRPKAGILTAFILLLFYSYGHVFELLIVNPVLGFNFGHHSFLSVGYLVLFGVGIWWILMKVKDVSTLTLILNWVGVLLIITPSLQIVGNQTQSFNAPSQVKSNGMSESLPASSTSIDKTKLSLPSGQSFPDVYYIILDMHTRSDSLKQDFNTDNSAFLDELRQLGFYVAECSRSNYGETRLSLASSLNLNYLDALGKEFVPENPDKSPLTFMIRHSTIRQQLEELGYKTVAFETGFLPTEITDVDNYIKTPQVPFIVGTFQPFEALIWRTTVLRLLSEAAPQSVKNAVSLITFPYRDHYRRTLYNLDTLKDLPNTPEPKFVFAHIISPHYPFIFAADGSLLKDPRYYNQPGYHPAEEFYVDGYHQQVQFVDQRILTDVKEIIAKSKVPPIIVIQGDHGARDQNRMNIFNAYYLPGKEAGLYPSISPVNTFRVIDNAYFGTSYPILKDVARLSDYVTPYRFQTIPETSPVCMPSQ